METGSDGDRFRFFLPSARVLTPAEVLKLPEEKLELAKNDENSGLWLEVECPASCVDNQGNINIPAKGTEKADSQGLFLRIFCPEGSCKIVQSTDLP